MKVRYKMAQYYASIQGNRGQGTRMGTKKSGIDGHIRGWNIGCRVWMQFNKETQQDECVINLTGGSTGQHSSHQLGVFTVDDLIEREVE